jgi:electron transport complex protein RnfA
MPNKFAWFLTLAVFSGLSMNLILRFGIGLHMIALDEVPSNSEKKTKWAFLVWPGIYFISLMLLWLFFSFLQSVLFLGFFEYILVFPVSVIFFTVIEYLAKRLVLDNVSLGSKEFFLGCFCLMEDAGCCGARADCVPSHVMSANGAMVGASLFIILGIAGGFAQAAVLSLGFAAGAALAVLIIGEIRRRSGMEAVPRFLRGGPLVFVTMGLLSLVFTSAAIIFYAVLEAK